MQGVYYETVRARLNGKKVDDKWLARFMMEVLNRFSPAGDHPIHELIFIFDNEAMRYKLTLRQTYAVAIASDCIRYGWTMIIAGKTTSFLTLPSSIAKRWKCVCYKALEVGANIAAQAVSVPS